MRGWPYLDICLKYSSLTLLLNYSFKDYSNRDLVRPCVQQVRVYEAKTK